MQTRQYSDIDLNFKALPISGDVSKNIGNLAPIRAIENLVNLNFYEAPFQPGLGSNINKLLFENISDTIIGPLQKEITNLIKNYEPRATLYSIDITADEIQGGYSINVEFYIDNSPEPVAINMFLERIGL